MTLTPAAITRLEPCPFCGGEADKLYPGGSIPVRLYRPAPAYGCPRCQVALPTSDAWNTRADRALAVKDEWECFSDVAYFDMWCVRRVGSREFGEGFHVVSKPEAEGLCSLLNALPAPPAPEKADG